MHGIACYIIVNYHLLVTVWICILELDQSIIHDHSLQLVSYIAKSHTSLLTSAILFITAECRQSNDKMIQYNLYVSLCVGGSKEVGIHI